jgi:hypothetical protein
MAWQRIVLLAVGLITVTIEGAKIGGTLYFLRRQPERRSGVDLAVVTVSWGPNLLFGSLLIAVAVIGKAGLPFLWTAGAVIVLAVPARWLVSRRLRETSAE